MAKPRLKDLPCSNKGLGGDLRSKTFMLGKPYVILVDDNLVLFPAESLYGGDLINDLLSK